MSQGNQILGNVGIQAETSFGGSATGTLYHFDGITEFEWEPDLTNRLVKTSIFRQQNEESAPLVSYTGRFNIEAIPCASLNLALSCFFALRETESIMAGTRNVYVPTRAGDSVLQSIKFMATYDGGPWLQFNGVVIESLRVTARARGVVNIAGTWRAASLTQYDVDPSWSLTSTTEKELTTDTATLEIDDVAHTLASEFTAEFSSPRIPQNFNRAGNPTKMGKTGTAGITGSLTQYLDDANPMPLKVRTATEFKASLEMAGNGGKLLLATFPRIMPQSGQGAPIGQGDVTEVIGLRMLQDASLVDGDEVSLEIVF